MNFMDTEAWSKQRRWKAAKVLFLAALISPNGYLNLNFAFVKHRMQIRKPCCVVGHTFAWGYGQDYLLTPCYDYTYKPDGYFGPINPILKATYNFLQRLFIEILAVFPDKYVHLGGDEVPFDCWWVDLRIRCFLSVWSVTTNWVRIKAFLFVCDLAMIIWTLHQIRKQSIYDGHPHPKLTVTR